jgi:hypothetical protein
MPDEDLAEKLHRTPQEVKKRRISLGVRFREYAPAGRRWTIAEEMLVGTNTDRAIARKLNRTSHSVLRKRCELEIPGFYRRKPWTEADERLVRTLPARAAARRLRRTLKAVMHRRGVLGLRQVGWSRG